jgi:hypothetical protein
VGVKQQKSQEQLAFSSSGKVKPEAQLGEGTETHTAGGRPESQVRMGHLYRTARYGPVCRVVWEGGAARPLPIPIQGNTLGNEAMK